MTEEESFNHENKKHRDQDVLEFIEDLCAEFPKKPAALLVSQALDEVGEDRLREWLMFSPLKFVEAYIEQHRKELAERSRNRSPKAEVHNLRHKRMEKDD